MSADAATIEHFDAYLDRLAGGLPAPTDGVDQTLISAARTIHAAAATATPDPAFARQLRHSLVSHREGAGRRACPPSKRDALAFLPGQARRPAPTTTGSTLTRITLTERMAIAAIVLLFIAGLAVAGRLSLPARFGDDEPAHLAAPNVLTEDEVNSPIGTAASSEPADTFAQASMSSGSDDDPFPIGSTVMATTDGIRILDQPSSDGNVLLVVGTDSTLIVWGRVQEPWLPVVDAETGVDGFVMIDFVEASPAPAASPEPDSIAVLFILDKSGSMSYDPLGGTSKLEWEKETIRRALDALPDGGQIGVLAFNDQFSVAVPITRIENDAGREEVEGAIDAITADGGSELEPALRAGFALLHQTNAATKHAVLLSDGKARDVVPSALQRRVQSAHALGITLSVVAVGDDADTALLQFLAEPGGGRYLHIIGPHNIPTLTLDASLTIATPTARVAATPSPRSGRKHDLTKQFSPWSDDQ